MTRIFAAKGIFAALLMAGATTVSAQQTNAVADAAKQPTTAIWLDDVPGNGFRRGVEEAGFALGGGVAAPRVGDKSLHYLELARFYYGWMFGGLKAADKWYRGNWEVLEEGFAGGQSSPAPHYLIGETTLLRYSLATGTRWMPFFDAGIGVSATDIGHPDLGTTFEFNGQVGPGINYFWSKDSAFTVQYHFTHLSNADMRPPNQGINEHLFYVGMAWYF